MQALGLGLYWGVERHDDGTWTLHVSNDATKVMKPEGET
jgi:hypothetical protein